jgi:hypothetical protein
MVEAPRLTGGTIDFRSFGTPRTSPTATTSTSAIRSTTCTTLWVSMLPVSNLLGASQSAMKKSMIWATTFATVDSSPPDATADARSTPCFWR